MGHPSIVETVDTYGQLFPESEHETCTALDALLATDRVNLGGNVEAQ
jgi:hypothetical protein